MKRDLVAVGMVILAIGSVACAKKAPPAVVEETAVPEPYPPGSEPGPFAGEGLRAIEGRFLDAHFAFDSSVLDSAAQSNLKRNFETMSSYPGIAVEVEGHCDERGSSEYNVALGQRRAAAARDYLVHLGASPSSLRTISYGEEVPLDPGHDEAAWAKNRRAHFRVVSIGPEGGGGVP